MGGEGHMLDMIRRLKEEEILPACGVNGPMKG